MDEAQARAAATYNAAADFFDHPALGFWDRFGARTIERLALPPGGAVLDACCGAGASALPAARAVGPGGSVEGVDLAERLLELGRRKAEGGRLTNIEFRAGDFLELDGSEETFDAVVCVFGIFFVPDIPTGVAALWRLVRPGGCLAVTTWGPRIFEPATTVFWTAVGEENPSLVQAYAPWDRITEPAALGAALEAGGATRPEIETEAGWHPLASPEDWWAIIMGSGYRSTVEHLELEAAGRVRQACRDRLQRDGVTAVEANVVYAVARKP